MIIIASLIVLSILFCLVRCLCCGLECCCGIFACCNACCPSPRNRKKERGSKYADTPGSAFNPNPYHGYQPTPQPTYNSQPQYAQFDASKRGVGGGGNGNGDSLPAMPSWDNASSRRVADSNDMELSKMHPIEDEAKAPMLAHQAPNPHEDAFVGGMPGYQDQASQPGTYRGSPAPGMGHGHSDSYGSQSHYGGSSSSGIPGALTPGTGYQREQYSAYNPTGDNTKFQPTAYHNGQESGTAYRAFSPSSPRGGQQNTWKDI